MPKQINQTFIKYLTSVLVVVLSIGLIWDQYVEDRLYPKRWGVVDATLYRSGQIHPVLIEKTLRQYHIRAVIDLQYWEDKPAPLAEQQVINTLGISSFRFPLNGDGTGELENYAQAIKALHDLQLAKVPTLVHCAAGSQRTGGVIAAYRTLVQGQPAQLAVAEMQQFGWQPSKDQVLLDYLNRNMKALSSRLKNLSVIDDISQPLPFLANPELP